MGLRPLNSLIVVAQLRDEQRVPTDLVDHAVLVVDAAGPIPRQTVP